MNHRSHTRDVSKEAQGCLRLLFWQLNNLQGAQIFNNKISFLKIACYACKGRRGVFIVLAPTVTSRTSTSCPMEIGHFVSVLWVQCPVSDKASYAPAASILLCSKRWQFKLLTSDSQAECIFTACM